MPSIEWNKIWARNYRTFSLGKLANQAGHYGDQWGTPENKPHLKKLVEDYLLPFVDQQAVALEIGPGGGRWTQYMKGFKAVYCVDLNKDMLDYMRRRFRDVPTFNYVLTTGTDLPGIPPQSIDFAFSYGVFVHLDLSIIEEYLKSLNAVLKAGATFVVQFSDVRKEGARNNPGFSDNDPDRMGKLLHDYGFEVVKQEDELIGHSCLMKCAFNPG